MAWLDKRGIIQSVRCMHSQVGLVCPEVLHQEWHKIKKLMDGAHHLDAQRNAIDDDIL